MSAHETLLYEDGSMYIILSDIRRNVQGEWHWGIFLALSHPWGQIYHATNDDPSNQWRFEEIMSDTIPSSQDIMTALEIGRGLTENQISEIHNILVGVPVVIDGGYVPRWGENFTCRVWIKEALEALRIAG